MGILEESFGDLKRLKRKLKSKVVREVLGETKGERWNKRRLKRAQEAWAYYNGSQSRNEFMSDYLKGSVARNKKVLRQQVTKWDKQRLQAGKKLNEDEICEILLKHKITRTPTCEATFANTIEKNMPGGIREYGEFKFGGTIHRPDFYVNKDIVFEYKIICSNTELHTALGQALIYTKKYKAVFLIIFDARHGYDAVEISEEELAWLCEKGIYLIKYPLS